MFEIDEQSRITRLRGKELEMVERTRGDEILSWDRVAPSQKEQLKNWPKDKHALRVSPFTGEPVIPSDQIRKSTKKIEISDGATGILDTTRRQRRRQMR